MYATSYDDTLRLEPLSLSRSKASRSPRRRLDGRNADAPEDTRAPRRAPLWILLAALAGIALAAALTLLAMTDGMDLPRFALPQLSDLPRQILPSAAPHAADTSDWRLVLVNANHPMDPYQPELTQLRNNQAVDSRCYPDLQRMFDDARAQGLHPLVNSSWRSREEQQRILDETIASYVAQGYGADEARMQALRTVAQPGTSEHETGLAIDVTSDLHTSDADSAVHAWMAEHSWEYGWILRYPAGKEELTGIDNEPWHFRYVGAEAAREIYESGLCLEEYVG